MTTFSIPRPAKIFQNRDFWYANIPSGILDGLSCPLYLHTCTTLLMKCTHLTSWRLVIRVTGCVGEKNRPNCCQNQFGVKINEYGTEGESRVARFYSVQTYQNGKKHAKLPQTIPNCHKVSAKFLGCFCIFS
jgi:hypothetical protein